VWLVESRAFTCNHHTPHTTTHNRKTNTTRQQGPTEIALGCAGDPLSANALIDAEFAARATLPPATPEDGFLFTAQLPGGAWWMVANLSWALAPAAPAAPAGPAPAPAATASTNGSDVAAAELAAATPASVTALANLLSTVNEREHTW
jgi:hypothetical protein